MTSPSPKVTALDVARLDGVSQSAVSRVFTPGASASKVTVQKVRAAAEQLGYRPDPVARAMITGRTRIIGLVVAYLENQFYPIVLERLSRALQERGYHIRIGDDPYSVTGGWPSVYAQHLGGGFCGLPPSGRPVLMRVMDFYLHHEGLIRENWVPLDMLHLLKQMGVDVLARMGEVVRK